MRKPWVVVAVLLVAVLLTRCSGSGSGSFADGVVKGPLLLTEGRASDGMAAQVRGKLSWTDSCLRLDGEPVVWPEGTAWMASVPAVVLANGQRVRMGERVRGVGGHLQLNSVEELLGSDVHKAASQCSSSTGEVAVFNPGSKVRPFHRS